MSRRSSAHRENSRASTDAGFTLIEVLIVIVLMATIAGALALSISIVLRTSPAAEVRVDDARSMQGLVTWLPQDVDAAPPSGFDTDPAAWPCGGTAPTDSHNVLTVRWTERTDSTTNYASTYRYEFNGAIWRLVRYTCDDSSSTMAIVSSINLTSSLPDWDASAPPAVVTLCAAQVDNSGNCPSGSEVTGFTSPDVESIKFRVTRLDGVPVIIDAAPKNPDKDLADDPDASTNAVPTVSQTNAVVPMFAGSTVTVDLNATHNPQDSDVGDTLSVAIDSSEPAPPGIIASTDDSMVVTLTADASLSPGTIGTPLVLIISDPRAGWVDATLTIDIQTQPNNPPTVSSPVYDVQLSPGQTVVLPLDVTHGASDPDGDPLTASASAPPSVRVQMPAFNDPARPLDLTLRARGLAPNGPDAAPIVVTFDDGRGGTVTGEINVEIASSSPNNPPTVTASNLDVNMLAGDTVTLDLGVDFGATDSDGDPLSVTVDASASQPADIDVTLPGGLNVELTADPSVISGPIADPVTLKISDGRGGTVNVTVSITIDPTPPPPSDCVLGSLTASPDPVQRQGNGNSARHLKTDVIVTLTTTGSCDGLVLKYDTGDTSGLGVGTGRVFPVGSPSSIVIYGKGNGGSEKWDSGVFTLTASTTSDVATNSVTTTLTVN